MKVAKVQISKELLEQVLKADINQPTGRVITTDAPKDLEVLGFASIEGSPWTFEAYVKSETFLDIPEGSEPPLIAPFVYTVHYKGA